jgi:hypothetical protein
MYSILQRAYGNCVMPRMPYGVSGNDVPLTMFCANCGHSELIHSDDDNRRCLHAECDCNAFIVGAAPELSPQVFPT